MSRIARTPAVAALFAFAASAQTPPPPATPNPTLTLKEVQARALRYAGMLQSANLSVQLAREDTRQARANRLPSLTAFNQYIYTEGNGTPSGVFVANDGVHIYNEQAVVHEDLLSIFRSGEVRRAMANEAAARAKADIAARGLNATVVQNYFTIVAAQRKFTNAQTSLREAEEFLDITDKQEKAGEAARADVVKARIQLQQRQRDLRDAQAAIEKGKIALGVLIFPSYSSAFNVVDDVTQPGALLSAEEARAKAAASSPDVKAAQSGVEAAGYDVSVARYGYLPSLSFDFFYGIDANELAITTVRPDETRRNLGASAQVTLNVPIWNWGATSSKVRQAELRRAQAQLDLSVARRTLDGNLAAAQAEAMAAQQQLDSLRTSVDDSAESLRLTLLRYRAGEATALEVVDAQSTLAAARNAYDDGQVRYRTALANLEILTGTF